MPSRIFQSYCENPQKSPLTKKNARSAPIDKQVHLANCRESSPPPEYRGKGSAVLLGSVPVSAHLVPCKVITPTRYQQVERHLLCKDFVRNVGSLDEKNPAGLKWHVDEKHAWELLRPRCLDAGLLSLIGCLSIKKCVYVCLCVFGHV